MSTISLDYNEKDLQKRLAAVAALCEGKTEINEKYSEILANYLLFCMEKEEKKKRKLLTDNRMVTVKKHETSLEGLSAQLESGEDGVYSLMKDCGKETIFSPKVSITPKDLEEIPELRQVAEAINVWREKAKTATGKDLYIIKRAIIDLSKDQYIIKNAYRCPVGISCYGSSRTSATLDGTAKLGENGEFTTTGISLINPRVCEAILCNYSRLKEEAYSNFDGDLYYLMEAFDKLSDRALYRFPLYERLVDLKIDGASNIKIQQTLQEEFGIKHSHEYISSLWRNKIPNLIASAAEDQWLDYYFREEARGTYKRCGRCGEVKLALPKYFCRNSTSKDGYYSICKSCRTKKKDGEQ